MKLIAEHLTRQSDLIPIEKLNAKIVIIGAGAIGGWTALSLAKMGFQDITVWDYDIVEIENMNSQLYRFRDIGNSKVGSLSNIIEDFTNNSVNFYNEKYTGELLSGTIVISAVDSMEVRKLIWDRNKKTGLVNYIIDPRMGAETGLLYVMNPNDDKDITSYEKTLYTDDNAVSEPCTRKSTQYCALALSGLVCAQVKSLVIGDKYSRITQWNIPSGSFLAWNNDGIKTS